MQGQHFRPCSRAAQLPGAPPLQAKWIPESSRIQSGIFLKLTPQEKHIETAKALLGSGKLLNDFVSRLLNDIGDLKAMLHAISIGAWCWWCVCVWVGGGWVVVGLCMGRWAAARAPAAHATGTRP